MLIFDCDDFQVIRREGRPGFLLVTFSSLGLFSRTGSLADGHMFWGQSLAEEQDYAAFGFVAKQRNWFCSPAMAQACHLVVEHARGFDRVVAYGSGMGGYAALRWGRRAGAGAAVAFSPQYSIDPVVVGHDRRYETAFRPALHRGMEIRPEHVPLPSFLFVDPASTLDRHHADLIRGVVPDIVEVPVPTCGHECIRVFAAKGLAAQMLALCAQGDQDAVRRLAVRARRASAIRVVELAMRAGRRNRTATAQRIYDKYHMRFEAGQRESFEKQLRGPPPEAAAIAPVIRSVPVGRPASGTEEGPDRLTDRPLPRLVHLHIPKTAGTALRRALVRHFDGRLRIFPHWGEAGLASVEPQDYDIYSGHFGFHAASRLGGDIVTVLRHPVDRYVSVYYFWRQLYESGAERSINTEIASKYPLDEFVRIRDQPSLIEEFENRATFQVAYGSSASQRREMRRQGLTDDDILAMAVGNLKTFKAVGIQENMTRFADAIAAAYGLKLQIEKMNVTKYRMDVQDISVATRRAIQNWAYMDLELYQQASRLA